MGAVAIEKGDGRTETRTPAAPPLHVKSMI